MQEILIEREFANTGTITNHRRVIEREETLIDV